MINMHSFPRASSFYVWEGIRGSTKEYQKLDTTTQGDQIPRQSIEQIGMCLGTYG